ncbi:hypothetical protein RHMOL_Rhmol09G0171200 [Rhododendron molle]|uniref:Uncharacterized protein n=1 Tax=Rhododendron molle TaxID=49168 RepID=A0ACC0MG17_RHOML|nr:hypothetical protein RHMOL_Rhmol09G0171200 [Rhododendron molle]
MNKSFLTCFAFLVLLLSISSGVPGAYAARRLELEPPQYCTTDAQCRTVLHPAFKCVDGKCKCPKGVICLDQPPL